MTSPGMVRGKVGVVDLYGGVPSVLHEKPSLSDGLNRCKAGRLLAPFQPGGANWRRLIGECQHGTFSIRVNPAQRGIAHTTNPHLVH